MSVIGTRKTKAVYGYIRNYVDESNEWQIPDSIKHLCALFLSLWFDIEFNWDQWRGTASTAEGTEIDGHRLQFMTGTHYLGSISR